MAEMHSSGAVKRDVRLRSIPSGEEVHLTPRDKDSLARRSTPQPTPAALEADLLPTVMPESVRSDRDNGDLWSWMLASFIESFALYGASYYGLATLPFDSNPAEAGAQWPAEGSFHARRQHLSLASFSTDPGVKVSEFESRTAPIASVSGVPSTTDSPAGRAKRASFAAGQSGRWRWFTSSWQLVVTLSAHRRRKRVIKKTVIALSELDDQTLHDMGIPNRSQIEQVVRYCYDC
jgi:uncharacterized protein YjiS (DUF1127 family)